MRDNIAAESATSTSGLAAGIGSPRISIRSSLSIPDHAMPYCGRIGNQIADSGKNGNASFLLQLLRVPSFPPFPPC